MELFKMDSKSKKMFLKLEILFIVSGLLQGLSVVFTIPLFKALFLGDYEEVMLWLIYIAITALICFIVYFIGVNMGNLLVWEIIGYKTKEIGTAIIKLPLGWFDSTSKGKISKAILTDINTISHYPSVLLPEILTTICSSLVIGISLIAISIRYIFIIILMVSLMIYYWNKTMKVMISLEAENVRSNQKMESTIIEFAQLQAVLRASGALIKGWDRLNRALIDDREALLKTLRKKGESVFKYMLVVNIGTILILLLTAFELKQGSIEIYTFVGIVVAMIRFANPLAGLLGFIAEIFNIKLADERINSIVETPILPEAESETEIKTVNGCELCFKEVDFSYIEGIKVLKNINLNIPANKVTAIIGASGSGKSTINRLAARFWDVDSGEILINKVNIKDFKTEQLMNMISIVFQEVYLFNTTIRENLSIAKPDATTEEMNIAAKKAGLDEVINRLPHGWDTLVGEGGSLLSGGEKQRVSIARAFLKNAPILLLDEITSALDGVNEAIITKSIEELSKDKTVIIIAHRLKSIKNADQIAVIDSGKIVGLGNHESLIKSNKKYQMLWNALWNSKTWEL
ncbi:MAG: ABC transporter ATP-binding protein [Tissierellia bacterium]|nr:ABC transporter ATP-binding protein [Tissierellia bacterium]